MNIHRFLFGLLLGRRLPRTKGTLQVAGIHDELTIHRDNWGIPHIEARNEEDAYFGTGFCHGQDRAFQLETRLRLIRGTLSELVGPEALAADRLSRRIGFYRASKAQWPVLDADVQTMVEAYTRGVNAGTSLGLSRRPHEFVLLKSQPTSWTPLDSLGLVKVISFSLSANWDVELARLKMLLADGPEAVAALDPAYCETQPVTTPPGQTAGPAADALASDLAVFTSFAGTGGGSNNWVIASSRSATGRPLLANDPHLDATLPSHWYLVHVRCPQWEVAGATMVGGPSVLSGHNGHGAWGVTAGMIDNTDLFRERIGPDKASVLEGDKWVPCKVLEEKIAVRGSSPVNEQVFVTPRGPIIGPALKECPWEALSLQATWLEASPIRGLLCLHKTHNFDEAREQLAQWPATSQNVVYADKTGTIGWQLTGLPPRRRKGNGLIPLAGWDPEVGWEPEHVAFDQIPYLRNSPEGFIATANNCPYRDGFGPYLGNDWIDGYRVESIRRNLAARNDWNIAAILQLQTDQYSIPWEEAREPILAVLSSDENTVHALELLRPWDGRLSAESPGAAVFALFCTEMVQRLARSRAPHSYASAIGRGDSALAAYNFFAFRRTGHLVRLLREQPDDWFQRSWQEEMADALAVTVRRLTVERGADAQNWGWGHVRTLTMGHPFGGRSFLAPIFNLGPVPCGGDADTINQASVRPLDPLSRPDSIASLRTAIDVGDWDNCRFVLPAGQSGNPLSPHYGDLFPLWQKGEGVPIPWSADAVRDATRATLLLSPGK